MHRRSAYGRFSEVYVEYLARLEGLNYGRYCHSHFDLAVRRGLGETLILWQLRIVARFKSHVDVWTARRIVSNVVDNKLSSNHFVLPFNEVNYSALSRIFCSSSMVGGGRVMSRAVVGK